MSFSYHLTVTFVSFSELLMLVPFVLHQRADRSSCERVMSGDVPSRCTDERSLEQAVMRLGGVSRSRLRLARW